MSEQAIHVAWDVPMTASPTPRTSGDASSRASWCPRWNPPAPGSTSRPAMDKCRSGERAPRV